MTDNQGERVVRVPPSFAQKARIGSLDRYRALYDRSLSDPDGFWAEQAERITWSKRWEKVSRWDFNTANIEWFIGGKTNVSFNCLDRHVAGGKKNRAALIWEGDSPEESRVLYQRAIAATPDSAVLYRELGLLERKSGDQAAALEAFNRAVSLDSSDAIALSQVAEILEAVVLFAGFKFLGGGHPVAAAGAELTTEEAVEPPKAESGEKGKETAAPVDKKQAGRELNIAKADRLGAEDGDLVSVDLVRTRGYGLASAKVKERLG